MVQKSLELGATPEIFVEQVAGELHIKGWKRSQALLKTTCENEIIFELSDKTLKISCPEDCILYAPHDSKLNIQQVGKHARLQALEGITEIHNIGGGLTLRDVGATRVENVGAEFSAKRVRGDLRAGTIGGGVRVRDIDGQFSADSIGGNLRLSDVSGGVSAVARGSARIEISPVPWQAYTITAGGNIRCHAPEDLNAEITFSSGAQKIQLSFPNRSETIREGLYNAEFGEGGTSIQFNAGGKIELVGLDADWDSDDSFDIHLEGDFSSMAESITRQATEQIEAQLGSLNEHLSGLSKTLEEAGLPAERSQEIHQRLEQARLKATQRAQAAAERAQANLERKLAAAQRKAVRETRKQSHKSFSIDMDALQSAAKTGTDPVSDEERLLILKMLQDNSISVEQAEELLSALEGK